MIYSGCPKGAVITEGTLLEDFRLASREPNISPLVQMAIFPFAYMLERDNFQVEENRYHMSLTNKTECCSIWWANGTVQ